MADDADQHAWLEQWSADARRDRHIRDFSLIGGALALAIIGIVGVRSGTLSPVLTWALILSAATMLARVAPTVLRRN